MILLKVTSLRKHSIILVILAVLACVLASTRANAVADHVKTYFFGLAPTHSFRNFLHRRGES